MGEDAGPLVGLPYPEPDETLVKAIQTDFWDRDEILAAHTGGVAVNLVWDVWEPTFKAPPCAFDEAAYDGHCFRVDPNADETIRAYSDAGLSIVGVVYGVPAWARTGNTNCSPNGTAFERFCTSDDAADYARFAGLVAERYDGQHGHGRIADFVIHNEVNSNIWFDIGCGSGTPCDIDAWIEKYATDYAAAYDAITAHQSRAKVMVSFEHHFDTDFDEPAAEWPLVSVKTFLTGFATHVGDRAWRVAYHPYAPSLLSPEFGAFDLPRVTYGNLGVLLAWLRREFPDDPHAWEVELTESGISSGPPDSSEAAQATAVCDSFKNVLGTPGVTHYVYHRMQDHPTEEPLRLGLARTDGTLKPAWSVWANANAPGAGSCGFEELPYTRLVRSVKSYAITSRHWASSRLPPPDFAEEMSWRLLREEAPGTELLYECLSGPSWAPHNRLSLDVGCDGETNLGPVGWIYATQEPGTVPLHRCASSSGNDHFVSEDPSCEGQVLEVTLGYATP